MEIIFLGTFVGLLCTRSWMTLRLARMGYVVKQTQPRAAWWPHVGVSAGCPFPSAPRRRH
jgi:hypothetical protein